MDAPFWVEPDTRQDNDCWAIRRNCETLCTTRDVTFAYRLVELLNKDEQKGTDHLT